MTEKYSLTHRTPEGVFAREEFDDLKAATKAGAKAWAAGASRIWVWEPVKFNKKGAPQGAFRHMPTLQGDQVVFVRTLSPHGVGRYSEFAEVQAARMRKKLQTAAARQVTIERAAANG